MKYDYECDNCGNIILIERKIDEPEQDYDCPQCFSTLSRKWSSPAVQFKGTGFYSTDK